jgi:DNA repair protein RadA/Sms
LPLESVWYGEISLAGEVRPVAHSGLRLRESAKLGFTEAVFPAEASPDVPGMRQYALSHVSKLVDRIVGAE